MTTFLEALESFARSSGLARWAELAARWQRIQRWKLVGRCNAFIGEPANSANDHYRLCNRVKGHPRDIEPDGTTSSGCCGSEDFCDGVEWKHNDVCKCLAPSIYSRSAGRCVCGGFPLEANQPPAVA